MKIRDWLILNGSWEVNPVRMCGLPTWVEVAV